MTVYDPAAFAPLTEAGWNEGSVRAAPTPLKSLYVGAAGVIRALDALRGRGHAEIRLDLGEASRLTLDAWRREPDFMRGIELPEPARAGLLTGQSGILAIAYVLTRDEAVADELYERVRENVDSTATGIMWGSPGTMVASRAILDRTGDARWADAWRDGAGRLLEARDEEGLWTQRLYCDSFRGLSPRTATRRAPGSVTARGKRLCPARGVRANARRAVARARAPLRRPCGRADGEAPALARSRPVLALHRRPRVRALRVRLPGCPGALPDLRRVVTTLRA